jgi:hypothetical protein
MPSQALLRLTKGGVLSINGIVGETPFPGDRDEIGKGCQWRKKKQSKLMAL